MNVQDSKIKKLLILLSNLSTLASKEEIINGFIESLRKIWPEQLPEYQQKKPKKHTEVITISESYTIFGYICFADFSNLSKEDWELLKNAATLLGILLKKNEQDKLIKNEKFLLTRLAEEKTVYCGDSEIKYRNIFENIQDVYYETSLNGIILEISPSIWNLSQERYHREDIIGKSIDDFYLNKETRLKALAVLQEKGYIHDYEVILKNMDGSLIPCSVSSKIYYDDKGNPLKIIGSMHDITERKHAQEALLNSEASYRYLFEQNPAPMLIYELGSLKILAVNEAFVNHYGYSKSEIASMLLTDLYPESEKESISNLTKRLIGFAYAGEWHHLKKDGTQITIEVNSHIINYESRTARIAVISDITTRKQAELALLESEEIFKRFMEHSPIYVFFKDENIRAIRLSKNYELMLGMPLEEILGKSMDELFPSELAKSMVADDMKILKDGKELIVEEELKGRYYKTIKFPIHVEGRPRFLAGYTIDITEQKQSEKAIQKLNAELEQRVIQRTIQLETANKELEAFSYSVSHDLRAPLRHISGFINIFLEEKSTQLTEKELEYLKIVTNAVVEMGKLIDALLSFSRLNRTELRKTKIETPLIIHHGIHFFENEIKERNIEIIINPLHETLGDFQLIGQVWTNLISNAIKYTRKKDKAIIEIGSYLENNQTIFFIKDNGAGFNMKYVHKLFGVFQRLHRHHDFEGIGIGLANINRIITRHGGRCWAEGEPDKGATFYFSLPDED